MTFIAFLKKNKPFLFDAFTVGFESYSSLVPVVKRPASPKGGPALLFPPQFAPVGINLSWHSWGEKWRERKCCCRKTWAVRTVRTVSARVGDKRSEKTFFSLYFTFFSRAWPFKVITLSRTLLFSEKNSPLTLKGYFVQYGTLSFQRSIEYYFFTC